MLQSISCAKMTHIMDYRLWVNHCVTSEDQVGKIKSSGTQSANSLDFTPQVSLTSLNTLHRPFFGSLHSSLLNSDFRLALQHGAVRDYHILKKILLPQVLH